MSKIELREVVATLAHDQWSGWMKYLFSKCELNEKGEAIIPEWAVKRWKSQMNMSYLNLSTPEKESDRAEADKFLAVFNDWR